MLSFLLGAKSCPLHYLVGILFVLSFFSAPKVHAAPSLTDRNIKNAKLLVSDDTGDYFGVYLTRDGNSPTSKSSPVQFNIIANKKLDESGVFLKVQRQKIITYPNREIIGEVFDESEILHFNSHIIPEVKKHFAELDGNDAIVVKYFIDKHNFQPVGGLRSEYRVYEAEYRLFEAYFKYNRSLNAYRPVYNLQDSRSTGWPVGVFITSLEDALSDRKPLALESTLITAREKTQLLFDKHQSVMALNEANKIKNTLQTLNDNRRKGIVYKSHLFWDSYPTLSTARNVLDGQFAFIFNSSDFANIYVNYIEAYFNECASELPSKRKSYTSTLLRERFGISSIESTYYVEMENRFANNYERFIRAKETDDIAFLIRSIGNSVAQRDNGKGLSFFTEIIGRVADDQNYVTELRGFIKDVGCKSATISQLADNLIRAGNADSPVQKTNRTYSNAHIESQKYTVTDAQRFYDLSVLHQALSYDNNGAVLPLFDEELREYAYGRYVDDGQNSGNSKLHAIGKKIADTGHPVLSCYYGPTGIYDDGRYEKIGYYFWYDNLPEFFESYLKALKNLGGKKIGLQFAVESCPSDSQKANQIISGM